MIPISINIPSLRDYRRWKPSNQLRGTETRGMPKGVHTVDLALQWMVDNRGFKPLQQEDGNRVRRRGF